MKKSVLLLIGLAFIGIEGMAQRGQGQGRGPDIDRNRQGQGRGTEMDRNRQGQGRGQMDRNRQSQHQYRQPYRGQGQRYGGNQYARRSHPNTYYNRNGGRSYGYSRGNTRVVIRSSPGIRYDRYYVRRPGFYVNYDINHSYSRRVLLPGEINRVAMDMEYARFDDDALQVAKASLRKRGVRSADVAYLMKQLTFEDNRLALAKFAWSRTVDKRNFFKVYNTLKFKSSQSELDRFINRY